MLEVLGGGVADECILGGCTEMNSNSSKFMSFPNPQDVTLFGRENGTQKGPEKV